MRRRRVLQPPLCGRLLVTCVLLGIVAGCIETVGVPPIEAPTVVPVTQAPSQSDTEATVLQDLHSYLNRFAGASPLDCGQQHVRSGSEIGPDQLQRSLECGRQAASQKRAFVTYRTYRSLDHIGATGVVGTPDGEIFHFRYDSGPFFVGRWWMGSFRVTRCPEPRVTTERGPGAVFECPA